MSKVVRSVKNVTKGYSHVQVKVRNGMRHARDKNSAASNRWFTATSNDPWGPTGTEMSEIAQMTFNGYSRHPLASSTTVLSLVAPMTSTK